MKQKYCLIAVEGPHDQAVITRILQLSGFEKFSGNYKKLDAFWEGFIPKYPKGGNLYTRMDMPSILTSQLHSVAIYVGEGTKLVQNLTLVVNNYKQYAEDIDAFGLIVDADKKEPKRVAELNAEGLKSIFPMISNEPGIVTMGVPRTGIYVLPDNERQGVLDSILMDCASIVYPFHKIAAESFVNSFEGIHTQHFRPFDKEKALIASIVSILKPGMANTPSIAHDEWISEQTIGAVQDIAQLYRFIKDLLDMDEQ